jgi:lipopolysaccharide export system protein LptA
LLVVVFTVSSGPLAAQGDDCDLLQTTGSHMTVYNQGSGNEMVFIGGGARFVCPDGLRIQSDSVAYYAATEILEFMGRVRYSDAENGLTADYMRYLTGERRVMAQNDVVLTDVKTGSVITAPFMDYFQASDTRPESLVQMLTGRPHAVLLRRSRTDSTQVDTTVVDGDAMEIAGQRRFTARGRVEITRGDTRGYGAEAVFDQDSRLLNLMGAARLVSGDYQLAADSIDGVSDEADELREVTGRGSARLDSEDTTVEAPRVRILFVDGEVDRLVAVARRDSAATSADSLLLRARAMSRDFRIIADSIDALAPGQRLEEVRAIGRAYGERLNAQLGDATVPAFAASDWLKGETVIANFGEDPDAEPDSAGRRERVLEQVTAVGGTDLATSSYRVIDEEDPDSSVSINYLRAQRIVINLVAGEVSTVDAEGQVQGVYLQPIKKAAGNGRSGTGSHVR